MKTLILITALFCSSALAQDSDFNSITNDTVQANDAINSPTSIMSNTQINSGVTFDSYGAGVTCARTTIQIGAIGNINGHSRYNTGTQAYIGINIPFGDGQNCKDAASAQLFLNKQRKITMVELMRRENESHKHEMKKKDLMYADLLAKVCANFHDKLVAANDSVMAKECNSYKVIDHHKPSYDINSYSRIADH